MSPVIALLMGSDSDLPTVKEACKILTSFALPFEVRVLSAHRCPDDLVAYVRRAEQNGVKVFIAAAGGAAHLAGVVAAHTTRPVIGMCARLATEKGVEILVEALEIVRRDMPGARVLFAGPYRTVVGEEQYAKALAPRFDALGEAWTFTGPLQGRDLSAFFGACDMTVLPSLNSTESFGLVQVESMLCGTPSICSDLPGVRVPVQTTGMGEVVPVGDALALAQAILRVAHSRDSYVKGRDAIAAHYSTARTLREYELLYGEMLRERTSVVTP